MTVDITNSVKTHTGNDATTVWPYDFFIPSAGEVTVEVYDTVADTTTVLTTSQYSITGVGDAAFGNVTYPLSGTPLTTTEKLIIRRTMTFDQGLDISNQTGFLPEDLEAELDSIVFQILELKEQLNRTIKGFPGETFSELSPKTAIANTFLKFDADGNPTVVAAATFASITVPPSSVDGGHLRWDGTDSSAVQASVLVESDTGNFTGPVNFTISGNFITPGIFGSSATGYMLIPVGTTAQRPGSPSNGMLRYNTDDGQFEGYTAGAWGALGGAAAVVAVDDFTGDGATTAFVLGQTPAAKDEVSVYIDGVRQHETEWSLSTATVTFTSAPYNGADIEIQTCNVAGSASVPADTSVTAAKIASNAVTTDKIIDGAVTPAKTSGMPFTEEFESTEQTITSNTSFNLAHGLSQMPKFVTAELVCKTAELGYAVNDVVEINFLGAAGAYNHAGVSIIKTTTQLQCHYGVLASPFYLINRTNGQMAGTTNANWRLKLRAWA